MSEDERDFGSDVDHEPDADSGSDSRGDPGHRPEDGSTRATTNDDTAREWGRIPIDVDERADDRADPVEDGDGDDETEDGAFGPEPSSTPIESGTPSLENALFVVLGAIAMGLVLFRLVSLGIGG